jgi:septum formation protein
MSEIQNPLVAHLSNYKIILASNSPRRKELLAQLGLEFTVRTLADVDESFPQGLTNEATACYIAKKKAEALAAKQEAEAAAKAEAAAENSDDAQG